MVTATGPIPSLSSIAPLAPAAEEHAAAPLLSLTEPQGPDVAELSQLGALLSRLTDLQRTDPEQAHRALLAMASDLAGRAALSGGDAQLRALADAFTRAAETGDLSGVHPLGPPRADELIESTAPHTATAQGQAASYALGQAPAQPGLESLLEDALSRTKRESHSPDRVEQQRAEQVELEPSRAERAELAQRSTDRIEQQRAST